jgi:hypothetical protein
MQGERFKGPECTPPGASLKGQAGQAHRKVETKFGELDSRPCEQHQYRTDISEITR